MRGDGQIVAAEPDGFSVESCVSPHRAPCFWGVLCLYQRRGGVSECQGGVGEALLSALQAVSLVVNVYVYWLIAPSLVIRPAGWVTASAGFAFGSMVLVGLYGLLLVGHGLLTLLEDEESRRRRVAVTAAGGIDGEDGLSLSPGLEGTLRLCCAPCFPFADALLPPTCVVPRGVSPAQVRYGSGRRGLAAIKVSTQRRLRNLSVLRLVHAIFGALPAAILHTRLLALFGTDAIALGQVGLLSPLLNALVVVLTPIAVSVAPINLTSPSPETRADVQSSLSALKRRGTRGAATDEGKGGVRGVSGAVNAGGKCAGCCLPSGLTTPSHPRGPCGPGAGSWWLRAMWVFCAGWASLMLCVFNLSIVDTLLWWSDSLEQPSGRVEEFPDPNQPTPDSGEVREQRRAEEEWGELWQVAIFAILGVWVMWAAVALSMHNLFGTTGLRPLLYMAIGGWRESQWALVPIAAFPASLLLAAAPGLLPAVASLAIPSAETFRPVASSDLWPTEPYRQAAVPHAVWRVLRFSWLYAIPTGLCSLLSALCLTAAVSLPDFLRFRVPGLDDTGGLHYIILFSGLAAAWAATILTPCVIAVMQFGWCGCEPPPGEDDGTDPADEGLPPGTKGARRALGMRVGIDAATLDQEIIAEQKIAAGIDDEEAMEIAAQRAEMDAQASSLERKERAANKQRRATERKITGVGLTKHRPKQKKPAHKIAPLVQDTLHSAAPLPPTRVSRFAALQAGPTRVKSLRVIKDSET